MTLADLFLRKILTILTLERRQGKIFKFYEYIEIGINFTNHDKKKYEDLFLNLFIEDKTRQVLFRNLIKIGFENSRNRINFRNKIIRTPTLKNFINQNLLQKIFSAYSLTTKGYEIKQKIEDEIKELNRRLIYLNDSKANEVIETVGANTFFLKNLNRKLFLQIDEYLSIEIKLNSTDGDYDCT